MQRSLLIALVTSLCVATQLTSILQVMAAESSDDSAAALLKRTQERLKKKANGSQNPSSARASTPSSAGSNLATQKEPSRQETSESKFGLILAGLGMYHLPNGPLPQSVTSFTGGLSYGGGLGFYIRPIRFFEIEVGSGSGNFSVSA